MKVLRKEQKAGRVTPCAPFSFSSERGAYGVTRPTALCLAGVATLLMTSCANGPVLAEPSSKSERQITRKACGHVLTNIGVWSPDGHWLVYDTRHEGTGLGFNGNYIEMVHVETGEIKTIF